MIEKIFGKVIDFPKITLCGILLLTMIWALFIPNLTIDFSIEHLFSQNDPAVEEYFSFRDDFGRENKILSANKTSIDFIVEDKIVILVDDVLYTGRSIRSALTALQSFGRPKKVELLTLIDRRFSRHLPIQPDYCGIQVDSINNQRLTVKWKENDGEDAVYIYKKDGKN